MQQKEATMGLLFTLIVLIFVVGVLLLVGFALVEIGPLGRHRDHYRNAVTGKRRWDPPNLEDGHY